MLDEPHRVPDAVCACRARRADAVIRTAETEAEGEDAGGEIGEETRDEERVDGFVVVLPHERRRRAAAAAGVGVRKGGIVQDAEVADAGAEGDACAV
jgi:hypothetical protein